MPKLKVTLSIGYPGATHEDILDVDDDDYNACETEDERDELCADYWKDWSNNYIEGEFEVVE